MLALQSLAGVILIPLAVWAFCETRELMGPRRAAVIALSAIAVQFLIALLLLKMPFARVVFDALGAGVFALQTATDQGAQLLFGYLAGGAAPFETTDPGNAYLVAFRVLPIILVLSAIVRLLYYWGVLQRVVQAFALLLQRTAGTGGPLATVSAASIFLGIIEAPVLIRPYIKEMGRGALFAAMVVIMSTVAGTVMALYASILAPTVPGVAGHLLAASLMNVPGALMLARLAVPKDFEGGPRTAAIGMDNAPQSSMDAITQGAIEGLNLVATVAALLIVIVSLVALVNIMIAAIAEPMGYSLTLQSALGFLMAPLAFIIGIPWSEAPTVGALLGQKLVLNEFLAYLELSKIPLTGDGALSERSRLLVTYALCGFANLGSLGILIGGLTAMAPERRVEIVTLAPRAVVIGFLTTLLSAAIIGCIQWS